MVPLYFKLFQEVLHIVGFVVSLLPASFGDFFLLSVYG